MSGEQVPRFSPHNRSYTLINVCASQSVSEFATQQAPCSTLKQLARLGSSHF